MFMFNITIYASGKGNNMLGGSVYIAFIRFAISLVGVIILFTQISQSRFQKKKTILYYGIFSIAAVALGCIWYLADWESCVRMVAFTMYMSFVVFSIWISRDSFYLAVYKLALVFWLMAIFVIGGLEVSILLLTEMYGQTSLCVLCLFCCSHI